MAQREFVSALVAIGEKLRGLATKDLKGNTYFTQSVNTGLLLGACAFCKNAAGQNDVI